MYVNLQFEMLKQKVTQTAIAEHLNISRGTVANKISGKTSFTVEESFKIRERFFPNCDMQYLFKKTLQSA